MIEYLQLHERKWLRFSHSETKRRFVDYPALAQVIADYLARPAGQEDIRNYDVPKHLTNNPK